jgi:hypothetical protein
MHRDGTYRQALLAAGDLVGRLDLDLIKVITGDATLALAGERPGSCHATEATESVNRASWRG